MNFIYPFLTSFFVALVAVPLVRVLAQKVGAVDNPGEKRRVHKIPTPRLGGLAIALGIVVSLIIFIDIDRKIWGLLAGFAVLLVLGTWDDIKTLRARHKLFWQIVAAIIVLTGGIGITFISNPFGGTLVLTEWVVNVDLLGFLSFDFRPIANIVTVIWIVGMINTINFLDGLDGLAGGVSAIGALVIFVLSVSGIAYDPVVATLSLILLGSILGFLPYNLFPSKIFMGDSGAYIIGLLLALLPIYSETKFIVGSIVLGLAIADTGWAILRRMLRKKSPFKPDRGHIHHMLIDSGIEHPVVVGLIYLLTIAIAVSLLTFGAVAGFVVVLLSMVFINIVIKLSKANN